MRKIAIGGQAITWLTWQAEYRPHTINEQVIAEYDTKMANLHPEIQSSLILVSALSHEFYDRLAPLMTDMYRLDAEVSIEARTLLKMPGSVGTVVSAMAPSAALAASVGDR
jgi:hypothetical protein